MYSRNVLHKETLDLAASSDSNNLPFSEWFRLGFPHSICFNHQVNWWTNTPELIVWILYLPRKPKMTWWPEGIKNALRSSSVEYDFIVMLYIQRQTREEGERTREAEWSCVLIVGNKLDGSRRIISVFATNVVLHSQLKSPECPKAWEL